MATIEEDSNGELNLILDEDDNLQEWLDSFEQKQQPMNLHQRVQQVLLRPRIQVVLVAVLQLLPQPPPLQPLRQVLPELVIPPLSLDQVGLRFIWTSPLNQST